ncbi:AAA family ATPase [uncultured Sphingomonas sp.]|uniref:AAA family ATPase n=1 Tax=uncultured Sphingomonas sp. TaxID=158754 RepID=UPI0035CC1702
MEAEGYSKTTVATQITDVRRVEKAYGDLDNLSGGQTLASIRASLQYSKADERAGRANPSRFEVDGSLYDNLAHFRATLNFYQRFLDANSAPRAGSTFGLTAQEILDAIARCDAAGSIEAFIAAHDGLGPPTKFWLIHRGKRYPSKAIVRDALAHTGSEALPGGAPCKAALDALGFVVIDWPAFKALRDTFLARMTGFEDFRRQDGDYWTVERRYKDQTIDKVRTIAGLETDDRAAGEQIYRALSRGGQGLPLSWRTLGEVEKAQGPLSDRFFETVARLARSDDDPVATIADGARSFEGLKAEGIAGLTRSEVLAIAITVVGTMHPGAASWFKVSRIEAMGQRLFGRRLFAHQQFEPTDLDEYLQLLRVLFALFGEELGWNPLDLFDVQGFVWVALEEKWDGEEPAGAGVDEPQDSQIDDTRNQMTTNLILFGPPGTGKTYATAAEAVRLCDEQIPADRDALMASYRVLHQKGRIGFVTFHQNYSYEDFVEGLRPVTPTLEDGTAGAGFGLQVEDGIFKLIAELAASNRGKASAGAPAVNRDRKVFKMSLGRSWAAEDDIIYQDAIRDGYVVLGWGGEVDWSDRRFDDWEGIKERWRRDHPEASGNDPNMSQMYAFRIAMQIGSLVVISDGNRKFRAIGEITGGYQFVPGPDGNYNHRRSVRWLWHSDESLPRQLIYEKELSQVSVYQMNSGYLNWDGLEQIVAGGMTAAPIGVPESYVLVIDEINRANISKVFGELITLLEPDKRLGQTNALTVRLPYSKQEFGVPANLHIIGTMNTADRSIALLDTALRRRFEFRELMPDPNLPELREASKRCGIDLSQLLLTLNERIEYLFDREHQVGHAYFIRCATRDDVDAVMRHKVIPLLAEYFYEDWAKVAAVLGDAKGEQGGGFLNRQQLAAPKGLNDEGDAPPRYRWSVRSPEQGFTYDGFAAA